MFDAYYKCYVVLVVCACYISGLCALQTEKMLVKTGDNLLDAINKMLRNAEATCVKVGRTCILMRLVWKI